MLFTIIHALVLLKLYEKHIYVISTEHNQNNIIHAYSNIGYVLFVPWYDGLWSKIMLLF
jgi:hypothetical protein